MEDTIATIWNGESNEGRSTIVKEDKTKIELKMTRYGTDWQHVGITRFLTQKLSWSLVNKFPHHKWVALVLPSSRSTNVVITNVSCVSKMFQFLVGGPGRLDGAGPLPAWRFVRGQLQVRAIYFIIISILTHTISVGWARRWRRSAICWTRDACRPAPCSTALATAEAGPTDRCSTDSSVFRFLDLSFISCTARRRSYQISTQCFLHCHWILPIHVVLCFLSSISLLDHVCLPSHSLFCSFFSWRIIYLLLTIFTGVWFITDQVLLCSYRVLMALQDVDGVPKMENSTPDTLFQRLEADGANLARWVGELYLELHNGTYTSQVPSGFRRIFCDSRVHFCLFHYLIDKTRFSILNFRCFFNSAWFHQV